MSDDKDNKVNKEPSLFDVAKSVLWAMIGVQKSKNHERDFKHGKPSQYIIVGFIAVAIFITILISLVKYALSLSGL